MIITKITSGLGNQLFQYAAGDALANRLETTLYLDTSWYSRNPGREDHEQFQLGNYFPEWKEATSRDLNMVVGLGRNMGEKVRAGVSQIFTKLNGEYRSIPRLDDGDFAFDPKFNQQSDFTYLDGNWQSELFFTNRATYLRQQLSAYRPTDPAILSIAAKALENPTVFIHVRRGDYVTNAHFNNEIGPIDRYYYDTALQDLGESLGEFNLIAFTNDLEWSTTNLPVKTTLYGPESVSDPKDILYLMGLCRHAVIANSSLSWWGAWLIDSPAKTIYAPEPWFADSWRNDSTLLPQTWRRIRRAEP